MSIDFEIQGLGGLISVDAITDILNTKKKITYKKMRVITVILDWSQALQDREVTAAEGLVLVKRICGVFKLPLEFKF